MPSIMVLSKYRQIIRYIAIGPMTAPQYNAVFRYHLLYRNVQIALVKILRETICGFIFLPMYTKNPSVPPIANDATYAVAAAGSRPRNCEDSLCDSEVAVCGNPAPCSELVPSSPTPIPNVFPR